MVSARLCTHRLAQKAYDVLVGSGHVTAGTERVQGAGLNVV
jgi:hypothetical protein